jgi:hypothetical protein
MNKSYKYDNIYYCCVQKTASQWIRPILDDPIIYDYTGMKMVPYRKLGLKIFDKSTTFPKQTIATHLYLDYETYKNIPKPGSFKTFFVTRDPRDCVVSWYFSAKYSHKLLHPIPQMREELLKLDTKEGLKYIIDTIDSFGYFDAQASWANSGEKVFKYEQIASDHKEFLKQLFGFLDIKLDEKSFAAICENHSFKNITKGRMQGIEDKYSHFRKGIAGDWKNYFDQDIRSYFYDTTKDLLKVLGYDE